MSIKTPANSADRQTSLPNINHVVSIGSTPFVAQALKDSGLRRYSSAFDWIFSGSGMLRAILLDDFNEFLNRKRYVNAGSSKSWGLPRYAQLYASGPILNYHDITSDRDFADLKAAVERTRVLLQSSDTKLFVHINSVDALSHSHHFELLQTLRATTANAQFLNIGMRKRANTAVLELISETEDSKTFIFTPSSEILDGLRFGATSDNLLLRQIFDHYSFDLLEHPTHRKPPAPQLTVDPSLIPPTASWTFDIQHVAPVLSRIDLHRLVEESGAPRPDPAFLYGQNLAERLAHYRGDQYLPPVQVARLTDASLVGPFFITGALIQVGGVHLSIPAIASNPCSDESQTRLAEMNRRLLNGEAHRRKIDGEILLLACNGHQIYGHWLIDFLPKLALLSEIGVQINKIRVLLPINTGPFGAALLALFGIREEQIVRHDPDTEILDIESLLIPSTLRWGGRCAPLFEQAVAYLNSRINSADLPIDSFPKRIFISRSLGSPHGRALISENDLIATAERFGFQAVAPETLPLHAQVALLRQATHIIGPYGSGLHGSIFNMQRSLVCGFHGPSAFDALQSGIGERLNQPTGYIFGVPTPTPTDVNANTVDQEEFRRFLDEQLG